MDVVVENQLAQVRRDCSMFKRTTMRNKTHVLLHCTGSNGRNVNYNSLGSSL